MAEDERHGLQVSAWSRISPDQEWEMVVAVANRHGGASFTEAAKAIETVSRRMVVERYSPPLDVFISVCDEAMRLLTDNPNWPDRSRP